MKRLLGALLVAGSIGFAACGSDDPEPTPTACLQDSDAYLAAVGGAPDEALLDGAVPISDCLVPEQPSGDLNTVAEAVVPAATSLNAEVRKRPAGKAATQLGYLVGALEEGASGTAGIHADLIRRINSAARYSDDPEGLGAEFERAFGAGYQAAREAG
jgi:hypothetical protein